MEMSETAVTISNNGNIYVCENGSNNMDNGSTSKEEEEDDATRILDISVHNFATEYDVYCYSYDWYYDRCQRMLQGEDVTPMQGPNYTHIGKQLQQQQQQQLATHSADRSKSHNLPDGKASMHTLADNDIANGDNNSTTVSTATSTTAEDAASNGKPEYGEHGCMQAHRLRQECEQQTHQDYYHPASLYHFYYDYCDAAIATYYWPALRSLLAWGVSFDRQLDYIGNCAWYYGTPMHSYCATYYGEDCAFCTPYTKYNRFYPTCCDYGYGTKAIPQFTSNTHLMTCEMVGSDTLDPWWGIYTYC
jgi:hypothetical protein